MKYFKKLCAFFALCLCFSGTVAADFSGKYEAENGSLDIKQTDAQHITFSVSTANAQCTGDISDATATLQDSSATFTGEQDCKITLEFKNKKEATVHEENCSFYHGAQCSFDASYAKKTAKSTD